MHGQKNLSKFCRTRGHFAYARVTVSSADSSLVRSAGGFLCDSIFYHYVGHDSRSSSLTVSLFGSDTVGDSSAAEDTPPVSFEYPTSSAVEVKVRWGRSPLLESLRGLIPP